MKRFLLFLLSAFLSISVLLSCSKEPLVEAEKLWKSLPVQYQGRIKPFDTLARENLKEIYGKSQYEKKSAVEVFLLILIIPDLWQNTPFILVEKNLRDSLGLLIDKERFPFEELNKNQKLALQLLELQSLEEKEEDLDSYFESLKKLQTRLILFSAIQTGHLIRFEPSKDRDLWLSLAELNPPVQDQFKKLISSYINLISLKVSENKLNQANKLKLKPEQKQSKNFSSDVNPQGVSPQDKSTNLQSKNFQEQSLQDTNLKDKNLQNKKAITSQVLFSLFESNMAEFRSLISVDQKTKKRLQAEVWYNSLKPFTLSWVFYLFFLIAVLLLFIFKKHSFLKYSLPLVFIGFAFHSLGMLLRSYIMSRPPVSNMFETVIWVPFIALIVGFLFYLRGNKWPFIAGAILSFICLLLTSLAPEVLDGRLQPLEAVLRSSFWLTTHVLTITMSYSFFFLAFVLGDMILIYYLFQPKKALSFAKKMYQPAYRLIQWGVVFLTGGTLLGAVWADYSWGRFWGWDPKESWALISLLAYLAILHGKLIGWITPLKMAIAVVLMFFLVIMAWYGVNFVLGAGLHSYGFGSGGVEYMLAFFILHLILCLVIFLKKPRL